VPKYNVFNATRSAVVNTIVADETFMAEHYEQYELVPEPPGSQYSQQVTSGQLFALMRGDAAADQSSCYSAVYRAAHAATTPDDVALEFLAAMEMPVDDSIDLFAIEPALTHFVTAGYLTQADKDRIMQGWPL